VRGGPTRGFGFRDDRKDLDGFARDVIEHPHFPNPKAILRLTQASEAFDPAPAYPGRPRKAGYDSFGHRIAHRSGHDGQGRRRLLKGQGGGSASGGSHDDIDLERNQPSGESSKPLGFPVGIPVLDQEVRPST
jgi:hypothetical protein